MRGTAGSLHEVVRLGTSVPSLLRDTTVQAGLRRKLLNRVPSDWLRSQRSGEISAETQQIEKPQISRLHDTVGVALTDCLSS